jgi:predicted XRE-type DNA-binding protein
LSTRQAEARTDIAHAEFSCIRNARLERFTFDRMLTMLDRLGQHVELSVTVTPRATGGELASGPHP